MRTKQTDRRLLAHELVHVVQRPQAAHPGPPCPPCLPRLRRRGGWRQAIECVSPFIRHCMLLGSDFGTVATSSRWRRTVGARIRERVSPSIFVESTKQLAPDHRLHGACNLRVKPVGRAGEGAPRSFGVSSHRR